MQPDLEHKPQFSSLIPTVVGTLLISAAVAWLTLGSRSRPVLDPTAQPQAVTARGDLAEDEKATIEVFQETSPSVVYITTLVRRENPFTLNAFEIPRGTGSGFVWSSDGYVVTNYHVLAEGNTYHVTLSDQQTYEARLVGTAPDKDLAVVRINAPPERLKPIPVGTSADLVVGQKVFAIGNPFGLDQTLTTGIVSALGREIEAVTGRKIHDVIQTDAAINPGNSGGPLLDSAGRLIGVNTAIYSPSGSSAGIGFAVPVDTVQRFVPELIRHGRVTRPGLGVQIMPDAWAARLRVSGVVISRVPADSPAGQAGLEGARRDGRGRIVLGDVITHIDGKPTGSVEDLLSTLEQYNVDDSVKVTVLRQGEPRDFQVTLTKVE